MTVFFTADWHLNHSNIIKHCNRPFSNVEEMNETIIDNYNKEVRQNDIVYVLGDLAYKSSYGYAKELLKRVNGKIIVIVGNHDKKSFLTRFVEDGVIKEFYDVLGVSLYNKYIWLSHYPHRSWNRSYHGSYHLYGHCHGRMPPYNLSFDVGVDAWKFVPISFDVVAEKMKELENNK